jgi:8-oxo-dGTP diphosphatase
MDNNNDSYFQVSIKGLFFNEEGKLMMIQEKDGNWEVPGGRIQKGEDFIACLKRECLEETGLECEVLEYMPSIIYPSIDKDGRGRILVFYKIKLNSLEFKPSEECVDIKFFSKSEIDSLQKPIQLNDLSKYL